MRCVHINIRKVAYIFLSMLINNVHQINMAGNEMDLPTKPSDKKAYTVNEDNIMSHKTNDSILQCPSNQKCEDLNAGCITCDLNPQCRYGQTISTTCTPKSEVKCKGDKDYKFTRTLICRYCYQTEQWEHKCDLKANCNSVSSPRSSYITNCTVNSEILCLGNRRFLKNIKCNWTGGYRWTTALALSITLGGFGADRFYLGHWQEGIGKLFSFGGLGVWTIIDVILISLHYLGPADGSLYI